MFVANDAHCRLGACVQLKSYPVMLCNGQTLSSLMQARRRCPQRCTCRQQRSSSCRRRSSATGCTSWPRIHGAACCAWQYSARYAYNTFVKSKSAHSTLAAQRPLAAPAGYAHAWRGTARGGAGRGQASRNSHLLHIVASACVQRLCTGHASVDGKRQTRHLEVL